MGNDIFDAVVGEPGTYLSLDLFGNLSWGFSISLYQLTESLMGTGKPGLSGANFEGNGFNVLVRNFADGSVTTTGLVPELVERTAEYTSAVLALVPAQYLEVMKDQIANGSSFASALSVAVLVAQAQGQPTDWAVTLSNITMQFEQDAISIAEDNLPNVVTR